MITYCIESNHASWSVTASDALTAICGWIKRGMREEDHGNEDNIRVRPVDSDDAEYPLRGMTGESLIQFQREARSEIDAASRTVRQNTLDERNYLLAFGKLVNANKRIGALEWAIVEAAQSISELLTKYPQDEQLARVRSLLGSATADVEVANG